MIKEEPLSFPLYLFSSLPARLCSPRLITESVPLIISFNTLCVFYLTVDGGFSTAGVLDIPLGALLLYYLPHIAERSTGRETGRETGEEQRAKGRGQGHSSSYKHSAGTLGQHDSSSEGKRGDIERDSDSDRDSSVETAQIASPFCMVDIRWLLQLNEHYSTEESNVGENMCEEDVKGTGNRLEKKTNVGIGKGKNEDDARDVCSTTSRKKEVLHSIHCLQNSVVIITKTLLKIRTVRQTRSAQRQLKSPQDSPLFAAKPNNGRTDAGGRVGKVVLKKVEKEVEKSRRTADKAISSLSGKIMGDDIPDEDVSRRAYRLEDEEVKEEVLEEVKLIASTIYTCSILGEYERFPFFSPLSLLFPFSILFFSCSPLLSPFSASL
jgi:hypothetical protein